MDGFDEIRPETGERLLIGALRRMVLALDPYGVVTRRMSEAFGEDAAEVTATTRTFLQAMAYAGRRRLAVGHPGSIVLTRDEEQLIGLIAAAQAANPAWLEAHLRWLAKPDCRVPLAIAARALGTALAVHGYRFVAPLPARPDLTVARPEIAARFR